VKLAVNTLIWTARFEPQHLALFPEIKAHGFDGVEVARFDFANFPAQQIRSAAADEGLGLVLCSAFTGDISLATEDPTARAKAHDLLRQACDAAHAMGADTVVGPFCAPVGYLPGRRRTADEWQRCIEGLQEAAQHYEQAAIRLAIEPLNRFETYFLNTCADAAALALAINSPNVGILYDTFHANIEEQHLGPAIHTLGKHLFHVHTCENDRGAPGSGHVNWNSVFKALNALDYDGWCVIESFGFNNKEIAAAACIWRDIAPTPAQIAWDGAQYLRQNFLPSNR
jgi:D-psicose/D-tagatose/L-ribulose 3-epimerase